MPTGTKTPEATRKKILDAAFAEFYANGFQGGSINEIVTAAGITKGALFHHFASKHDLGYAVLDDLIGPLLLERWLACLRDTDDPITALQWSFREHVHADIASDQYVHGCPLNNLAQEMSPLDAGFHTRINKLYDTWRAHVSTALQRGIKAGTVKPTVAAENAATLIVAAQMGIWGSGKSSRDPAVMQHACDGICDYLETLRA